LVKLFLCHDSSPAITNCEVVIVTHDISSRKTGKVEKRKIGALFSMIGAVLNSACVACDGAGFIKTGSDLSKEDLERAKWPLARGSYLLETSLPGVFAVGDVRAGNVKRVASAVGEGSIAVSFVHQVLAE
jgi:thioredoxin reductase (NADPH)